jgi:hypothetical protein
MLPQHTRALERELPSACAQVLANLERPGQRAEVPYGFEKPFRVFVTVNAPFS